ncbi:MAG: hypothetical protein MJ051_02425 [Akkermansia sp.]|nr:hypothetical protein [Akkermansia sp.]
MNPNELFVHNLLDSTKEGNIKWENISPDADTQIAGAFKTIQGLSDGYVAYLLKLNSDYLLITLKDNKSDRAFASQKLRNPEILEELYRCAQTANSSKEIRSALAFIKSDAQRSTPTEENQGDNKATKA